MTPAKANNHHMESIQQMGKMWHSPCKFSFVEGRVWHPILSETKL